MRLKKEWKLLVKKSRTIKLSAVAATASGMQIVLPYLTDVIPATGVAIIAVVAALGAMVSRITHNGATDGE